MHAQGFVLLKENRFDSAAFLRTLQQEWGIAPDDDGMPLGGEMLTFNIAGNLCAVSLMPAPSPTMKPNRPPPTTTTGRKR